MIENRLAGEPINLVWKTLSDKNKDNIIDQIFEFINYQKTVAANDIYSVKTGKKYENFLEFLTDGVEEKVTTIRKNEETEELLHDLYSKIGDTEARKLFTANIEKVLVHGDLIIHNLLTDGENLTGVLDWELALFGDQDYDFFRLVYYQECAKAYQTQNLDETYETDFLGKLLKTILKSDLIENKKHLHEKYQFVRAIVLIDALYWALNSDNPQKNINELVVLWKKNGVRHLIT